MPSPARSSRALLVVGHGSRVPDVVPEMETLVGHLRSRVEATVAAGWLDLVDPAALDVGRQLIADGIARIVLAPLLLFEAFHARVDLPSLAEALRGVDPRARISLARHLGLDARLIRLAVGRIESVADPADALLVVSSGSSDPDAQASAATAARMIAERTGHAHVQHAFASSADPTVPDAAAALAAAGVPRVALFSWSLLAGQLVEASRRAAAAALDPHGVALVDAGRLGPDPVVADVLSDRYHDAA
ncbi:MAG: sirohydrochlorin chelatase [Actinobacteria bacterium]|nr:sirohydrochlorin chelatase [Actinomycetota bacterium]